MITDKSQTNGASKKNRYRRAIIVSIVAHIIGAIILLFWYLPSHEKTATAPAASIQRDTTSDSVPRAPSPPSSSPPTPAPAPDVPAEQIRASIDSQISQTKNLTDERKLSELEKNLKRLDKVADADSVKEVSTTIASTLGLDNETYQPKEVADDGPFDPATAQIQDVVRVKSDNGEWRYESVLVDAAGRTVNVPMSAAEGQTTYDTFQQMKKYPMAEGIYRSIVMPMMQKMIEAEEVASKAALKAERASERAGERAAENPDSE